MGIRNYASTNPGGSSKAILPEIYHRTSGYRSSGRVSGGEASEVMGRIGILQSRPKYAGGSSYCKNEYNGRLPEDYQALLSLKGIGSYTAGAIASIAYGIAVPAVDGNVLRVISRITESTEDISKQSVRKKIEQQLQQIMPSECPGDFNQALMELGAIVCVPNGQAKCEECPVASACLACRHDKVEGIPVKAPKKARTLEDKTVFIIQDGEYTAIRKRPEKDFWQAYMNCQMLWDIWKGKKLFPM